MCCNGTLYEWGALTKDEEALAERGMEVERRPDYLVFLQPCAMLDGTRCTIYAERPGVCSGYRCMLLKRFDTGAISFGDAVVLVEKARDLLGSVQSECVPGESFRDFRTAWRAEMNGEAAPASVPADRARRSRGYMALALLNRFVDRHFRTEGEQLLVSPERAAELLRASKASKDDPSSA